MIDEPMGTDEAVIPPKSVNKRALDESGNAHDGASDSEDGDTGEMMNMDPEKFGQGRKRRAL